MSAYLEAMFPRVGEATYAWVVTRDHFAAGWPGEDSTVGRQGPENAPQALLDRLEAGEGVIYRLLDDDGEVMCEGRVVGDIGYEGDPLTDFGPYWGCTRYDEFSDGKWEGVIG